MKNIFLYTLVILLSFSACRKSAQIKVPYEDQETAAASTIDFFEASQQEGEMFQLDLDSEEAKIITTQAETAISFDDATFLNGLNEVVTGIVNIEVIEVLEQGDMMIYDKPTVVYLSENLLNTERQLYIKVTQLDSELKLQLGKQINIHFPSDEFDPNIKLYSDLNEGAVSYWVEEYDEINFIDDVGYEFISQQLGWLHIGKPVYINNDAPVCFDLPSKYNHWNTLIFIAYEDVNGMTRVYGDPVKREFCRDLPNGMKAQLVVISLQGKNNYHFDIQDITISKNLEIRVNPTPSNLQGIIDFLAAM